MHYCDRLEWNKSDFRAEREDKLSGGTDLSKDRRKEESSEKVLCAAVANGKSQWKMTEGPEGTGEQELRQRSVHRQ